MEGLRTKTNDPRDAYMQMFPPDGLSKAGGVMYFFFLVFAVISIVFVASVMRSLKDLTYQTLVNRVITTDELAKLKGEWKNSEPFPVSTEEANQTSAVSVIETVRAADIAQGDWRASMTMMFGRIYLILTILLIFAIFWSVRGQPSYIAAVSAVVIGFLWLCSLTGFLLFFSFLNKYYNGSGAQEYMNHLQSLVANKSVLNSKVTLPLSDILNWTQASNVNMGISFGLSIVTCCLALGFLFLFGVMVVIARTTVYVDK